MKTGEVLEWLSLAPADIPCWLAGGTLVWMWYAGSFFLAVVLAGVAILLSLIACYFGMRQRKDFSNLTNQSKLILYPLCVIVVIIAVCVIFSKQTFSSTPKPSSEDLSQTALLNAGAMLDRNKAKSLADSAAQEFVNNDCAALWDKLGKSYRKQFDQTQFTKGLDLATNTFGKVQEFEFKHDEVGKKGVSGTWKPLRTFWYAVQTTQHAKGTHFLVIEVILDEDEIRLAGIGIRFFPLGKIPPHLK